MVASYFFAARFTEDGLPPAAPGDYAVGMFFFPRSPRLRAAAALCFGKLALPNADYVLIARYSTAGVDFKELCRDLQYGVKKLNRQLNGETACVQEDDQTPVSVAD